MKEKLYEQLSALVDDELADGEQDLLLRQLGADAELRERLARYQAISDAMQSHLPSRLEVGFHKVIQAALQDEPAVQVEWPRFAGLFKPLAGFAVAASVAVVAVLSLQSVHDEINPQTASVASAPDYLRAELKAVPNTERTPQSLDAYVVNHNEYAVNRGMLPYVRLVGHEMNVDDRQ
ncbi:MAG: sigma-E factor negative regulatory protein [Gammaproteobacteria bacterium]|jgi:sigma-E factor negative regulatory protein RseA|nr:sigma-E factor negative regulatory protein [Gammaproteobacteria bacterium]